MLKKEMVSFIIPFLPVSVNSMYGIRSGKKGVRVFLRSEARSFKEKAKLFMPPRIVPPSSLIGLEFYFKANWFFKNKSIRKLDIQNFEKILIDSISDKYEFNDSQVWTKFIEKVNGVEEQVLVKIFVLEKD